ncbi:hypothetical protein [Actinoplanes sp. NPDC051859]|uniref:hypothetical protein n=1 Tax=Actinoplanes sp. NPDC051859 TaxID=3363909 RepID=UPI0037A19DFA
MVGSTSAAADEHLAACVPVTDDAVAVVAGRGVDWAVAGAEIAALVPPGAAIWLFCADTAGGPAQHLADLLQVEVIAPRGRPLFTPQRQAFLAGPAERFHRFRPGSPDRVLGRRWPAPSWSDELDSHFPGQRPGLQIVGVPAGLWLCPADVPPPQAADPAFGIAEDPDRCTIVVGRPGSPPPDADVLIDVLDELPVAVRRSVLVVPYGCGAEVALTVAGGLSRRWSTPVAAATGLPMLAAGAVQTVATGGLGWQPLVDQLVVHWPAPPKAVARTPFLEDCLVDETGCILLAPGWTVAATAAGLWLHRPQDCHHAAEVCTRPAHPEGLTIQVGVPDEPPQGDVVAALRELGDRLPGRLLPTVRIIGVTDDDLDAAGLSAPRTGTGAAPTGRWLSDDLLVVGSEDPSFEDVARQVVREPGYVTVVGAGPAGDWAWLADEARIAGRPVRLVASAAAAAAVPLAAALGSAVIAPDDAVVLVPDGTCYAVGDGWLRTSPDGTVTPAGNRHPGTDWEQAVETIAADHPMVGRLWVEPIPAGLWVFPADPDEDAPDLADLAISAPVLAGRVLLVVGSPGRPAPEPDDIVAVAELLPQSVRRRLALAPYGSDRRGVLAAARDLARRWSRPVALASGLPVSTGRSWSAVVVDEAGDPVWQPPVALWTCSATGLPIPVHAPSFLADLPSTAAGSYRITDRWILHLNLGGLWLAPAGTPVGPDPEWDAHHFTIRVHADGAVSAEAEALVAALMLRLPPGLRQRVRVTPAGAATPSQLAPLTTPPAPAALSAPTAPTASAVPSAPAVPSALPALSASSAPAVPSALPALSASSAPAVPSALPASSASSAPSSSASSVLKLAAGAAAGGAVAGTEAPVGSLGGTPQAASMPVSEPSESDVAAAVPENPVADAAGEPASKAKLTATTRMVYRRAKEAASTRLRRRTSVREHPLPPVRQLGEHLIAVGEPGPDEDRLRAAAPRVDGGVGVLAAPELEPADLAAAVAATVPAGSSVWLYVPDAGRRGADGTVLAETVAELTGVAVVAPLGAVRRVSGGGVFAGDQDGSWLRFSDEAMVQPLGRRWPAPVWGQPLDEADLPARRGLQLTPVMAGLWVLPAGSALPGPDDPGFHLPADPDRCVLLVGHPDAAELSVDDVVEAVDQLPHAVGEQLTVVPYGCGADVAIAIAERLSRQWAVAVAVATSFPDSTGDGEMGGARGPAVLRWRPLAPRLICRWPDEPTPDGPADRLSVLSAAAGDGWSAVVTGYGLWLRRPQDIDDDRVGWQLPADPACFTIAVGRGDGSEVTGRIPLLTDLVRSLPSDVLPDLRIVGIPAADALSINPLTSEPSPPPSTDGAAGIRLVRIPGGFWITDEEHADADDPEWNAAPVPDRQLLVYGRPGAAEPDPTVAADLVERLPAELRARLVVVPNGPRRDGCVTLGRELARRLGAAVPVVTGLPQLHAGAVAEQWHTVVVDDNGLPVWRPPVRLLSCDAEGRLVAAERPDFLSGRAAGRSGGYLMDADWEVQLVHFGAWLRPAGDRPDPNLPWDAERFTVVVDDSRNESQELAEECLDAFLQLLPADVLRRVHTIPASSLPDPSPGPATEQPARRPARSATEPGPVRPAADPAPARLAADPAPARLSATPVPDQPAPVAAAPPSGQACNGAHPFPFDMDHESSPEQRWALRDALGWRYDAHARRVTELLASRPGLRSANPSASGELLADLVAVRAYASGDAGGLVPAADSEANLAFAACVVSGLRRLPSRMGPVVADVAVPDGADAHRPGAVVQEKGLLLAGSPAVDTTPTIRWVIWSTTGRRLGGLVDGAEDQVMFGPGTRFRVLATDQPDDGTTVVFVLDEVSEPDHEHQERLVARLRAWAARPTGAA